MASVTAEILDSHSAYCCQSRTCSWRAGRSLSAEAGPADGVRARSTAAGCSSAFAAAVGYSTSVVCFADPQSTAAAAVVARRSRPAAALASAYTEDRLPGVAASRGAWALASRFGIDPARSVSASSKKSSSSTLRHLVVK